MHLRSWTVVAVCMILTGCGVIESEASHGYATSRGWGTAAMVTTADVRIITQRSRLGNTVICTEPSPDVAKALSSALSAAAQGGSGGASGSLSVNGSSAEAAAELAGRSTALLGLRDGLYRACEAYANGNLGQDAYALILSRYGQLMTTLFLGQDITGAAGVAGTAAIIQAMAAQAGAAAPAAPAAGKTAPTAKGADAALGAGGGISLVGLPTEALSQVPTPARVMPVAAAATPPAAAPSAPASGGKAAATGTAGAASAGLGGTAALALLRMNEDYMRESILGAIVVACINAGDPTRLSVGTNTFLSPLCQQIKLDTLQQLDEAARWSPIDPTGAGSSGATKSTTPPKTAPATPPKAVARPRTPAKAAT